VSKTDRAAIDTLKASMDVLDVDLRKIRYFVAVAEHLHFRRAAEQLHIAQPALSRQVALLEKELGVELLHRTTHRFELTEAGALNTPESLRDRVAAEQLVRRSGLPYTIVRPTWLTNDPPGGYAVTFSQDPFADGMIPRADVAAVCLAATAEPGARGRTFAQFAQPGPAPQRWGAMVSALVADEVPTG
jgi:uncharacterized protein YbjT (DUF2867 family)